MSINLDKLYTEERDVDLGDGISIRLRPVTFAKLKAAEAASLRIARARLEDAVAAADHAMTEEERLIEYRDDILGLADEIFLDALVEEFAVSWAGVFIGGAEDDDVPAELTTANWIRFRQIAPFLADRVSAAFKAPQILADAEGNGSALSSNGG